jgi:hypothetical protein
MKARPAKPATNNKGAKKLTPMDDVDESDMSLRSAEANS